MRRFLITAVLALAALTSATAQQNAPIPLDPAVRHGKLKNGMTYYVRHNEKPKGQADFYILHNVGAIQEEDNQQGLAHFLEHMAFNGTKNLPDKMLIEYLEKVGVKFGANLNAATSWDYTIYNMSDVPTSREGIIDSALLVLHDWSSFITLAPAEIDKERGVIMEELRTRDGASWRSTIAMLKAVGKGTKYAERNLIGYLDGLKSFGHDQLESFYHTWYRPDYQAVIVVGDVDADAVVAKIESLMADIPAPAPDAPGKERYVIPDNDEPIVSIFTDPEMTRSSASLYIKHRSMPDELRGTVAGYSFNVMTNYIGMMANSRLRDIAQKPDAPFLGAGIGYGGMGINPEHETMSMRVTTEDGKLLEGFGAAYTELEKIRRYGFTESEFERARNIMMSYAEQSYANRNDVENETYVNAYVDHFTSNDAAPDAETEWQLDSMVINSIPLEAVNSLARQLIIPTNRVIVVNAPEKEGLTNPTESELLAVMARVDAAEIEAYVENVVKEPLIADLGALKGSRVVKQSENATYGTTEWTLKNGIRVIVKPTKFIADQIVFNAQSFGGLSTLDNVDYYTGWALAALEGASGVSKFSASDLRKQLAGKNAGVGISVDNYSNGLSGSCSPKDLETMLQLAYLRFTSPRFDENDFNTMMRQYRAQVENIRSNPDHIMSETYQKVLYNDNFRRQAMSNEILDMIDFSRMQDIHSRLFAGANSFTFTFVGNVDMDTLKPLVEKYIGSLPTQKQLLNYVDDGVRTVEGKVTHDFKTAMKQPKVSVAYRLTGGIENSIANSLAMTFLRSALSSRYLESIREEKGGTYGVSVGGSLSVIPRERYRLTISFDTNEEMADELCEIIVAELEKIAAEGPLEEDFNKTREYLAKQWDNSLEQNGSWLNFISSYNLYGLDYIGDYRRELSAMTRERVRDLARKILADGNMLKVVMRPQQAE